MHCLLRFHTRSTYRLLTLAAVVVIAGLALAGCRPKAAWSPSSLVETVVLNEPRVLEVQFTPTEALAAVTVRVVPELAPFLAAEPSSFSNLSAGTPVSLNLTLHASQIAEVGVYDGTVQIKDGKRTVAKPLPVTLTVSVVPLPPDPGEAGKATLEGIDSDHDGVRDDIQRYIALTYPESEKTRAALSLLAKRNQAVLLASGDEAVSVPASRMKLDALYCLIAIHGSDVASMMNDELVAQLLNTASRFEAHREADKDSSGRIFWGPDGDSDTYISTIVERAAAINRLNYEGECDFDPDAMEN